MPWTQATLRQAFSMALSPKSLGFRNNALQLKMNVLVIEFWILKFACPVK
jgi:hypothetical protein